jgi:hypothetical protein
MYPPYSQYAFVTYLLEDEMTDLQALSERYLAAWDVRDLDAIIEMHSEDTQFWTHLGGEPAHGRTDVRKAFAEVFERFPEVGFHVYRILYGPDHWILDYALTFGDARFDCVDVVNVTDDGLVGRKDTFVDFVQLQAALSQIDVAEEVAS